MTGALAADKYPQDEFKIQPRTLSGPEGASVTLAWVAAFSLAGLIANFIAIPVFSFVLVPSSTALFNVKPAISNAANGTLTFTPAANAHGSATVTVVVAWTFLAWFVVIAWTVVVTSLWAWSTISTIAISTRSTVAVKAASTTVAVSTASTTVTISAPAATITTASAAISTAWLSWSYTR